MKYLATNFVRQSMDKRARNFIESADALVWEVLESSRTCRCRIQGSNEDIIVKFPQNVKVIPPWLRKGNAVRISFKSGLRGRAYVLGQGTTIPTPVAGEAFPDPGTPLDAILTGCQVTEIDPIAMGVVISSGTYQIDGVEYNLSVSDNWLLYGDLPVIYYGDLPVIYYGGDIIKYLDAAPSVGNFRYDAFCVGIDGVLDYLKGTSSSVPVKPDIPTGHLLVDDYILVIGGATEISNSNIGMQWTTPVISSIDINIEGDGISHTLDYDDGGGSPPQYTEADIVFTVLDQYGNGFNSSRTLTLTLIAGTGDLWSSNSGYNDSEVSQGISGTNYTFRYRREQSVDSGVVVFLAETKEGSITYTLTGIITLGA